MSTFSTEGFVDDRALVARLGGSTALNSNTSSEASSSSGSTTFLLPRVVVVVDLVTLTDLRLAGLLFSFCSAFSKRSEKR